MISPRGRLFVWVMLIASVWILPTFWFKGTLYAVPLGLLFLVLVWLTRMVWLPDGHGGMLVRRAALSLASIIALSYGFWSSLLNDVASKTLWPVVRSWAEANVARTDRLGQIARVLPGELPIAPAPGLVFVFVLVAIWLALRSLGSTQPMGEHPEPWKIHFPERDFDERLNNVCSLLRRFLERINEETRWSDLWFADLDAEVEVQKDGRRRRVRSLLKALRGSRDARTFLVLGDPGSGKSVALRKLATDLLNDVRRAHKLPIYVNLREWSCPKEWSEEKPPTVQEVTSNVQQFIHNHVANQLDVYGAAFWRDYYDRLCQSGRLFFILDSFDEIALLLDHAEGTHLLEAIAAGLHAFLHGEHESRGVLASRLFRRPPSTAFRADLTLEVRPLDETKINELFKKRLRAPLDVVRRHLSKRPGLLLTASNPFTAALLAEFINAAHARGEADLLPASQVLLYSRYVDDRLAQSRERFATLGVTREATLRVASELANFMFAGSRTGLEAPLVDFLSACSVPAAGSVVEGLCFARILRGTGSLAGTVSFVHRRFAEYFMVDALLSRPELVNPEAILADSRWREVLVLYCEVAPDEQIGVLVDACWRAISDVQQDVAAIDSDAWRHAVLSLRFLVDAFRRRAAYLRGKLPGLAGYIEASAENAKLDLLRRKLAVEAADLLSEAEATRVLVAALGSGSPWLAEIAFSSCRRAAGFDRRLASAMDRHLFWMNGWSLWRNYQWFRHSADLGFGSKRTLFKMQLYLMDMTLWAAGLVVIIIRGLMGSYGSLQSVTVIGLATVAVPFFWWRGFNANGRLALSAGLVGMAMIFGPVAQVAASSKSQVGKGNWSLFFFLLMLVPWGAILSSETARERSRSVFRDQLVSLTSMGCVMLFGYLAPRYPVAKWIGLGLLLIVGLAMVVLILIAIAAALYGIWGQRRLPLVLIADWRAYRRLIRVDAPTRVQIDGAFKEFKTRWLRSRYVQWLGQQNKKPQGTWPDGSPPGTAGDSASELLAQLDEKWLGLER